MDPYSALAVDATFEAFGKAATYTPPGGGSAVPCTVILDKRDPGQRMDDGTPIVGTAILEVRASEIAQPAKGGTFVVEATSSYRVSNRPEKSDPEALVWKMWAE